MDAALRLSTQALSLRVQTPWWGIMCFTIVCCVFSCLCSFPLVHAVITQGCQLHSLSVLALQKPFSSYPLGLAVTNNGGNSVVTTTVSDFQKPGWKAYAVSYKISALCAQLSSPSFICSTWPILVELPDLHYIDRFHSDVWREPVSLEKSLGVKKI